MSKKCNYFSYKRLTEMVVEEIFKDKDLGKSEKETIEYVLVLIGYMYRDKISEVLKSETPANETCVVFELPCVAIEASISDKSNLPVIKMATLDKFISSWNKLKDAKSTVELTSEDYESTRAFLEKMIQK